MGTIVRLCLGPMVCSFRGSAKAVVRGARLQKPINLPAECLKLMASPEECDRVCGLA